MLLLFVEASKQVQRRGEGVLSAPGARQGPECALGGAGWITPGRGTDQSTQGTHAVPFGAVPVIGDNSIDPAIFHTHIQSDGRLKFSRSGLGHRSANPLRAHGGVSRAVAAPIASRLPWHQRQPADRVRGAYGISFRPHRCCLFSASRHQSRPTAHTGTTCTLGSSTQSGPPPVAGDHPHQQCLSRCRRPPRTSACAVFPCGCSCRDGPAVR